MDLGKNESKRTQTCNRSHCVTAAKMPQKMNKTAKFIMLFAFFLCGLFMQIFVQLFAAFSCDFVSITLWYVCIFLKWFCINFVSLYGFSFSHFLNELYYVCEIFVQVLQLIVNSWTLFILCAITLFSCHFRYCCFVSFVCFLFICSHFWSFCGTCGVFLCNFWISLWKVYSSLSAHISQHPSAVFLVFF